MAPGLIRTACECARYRSVGDNAAHREVTARDTFGKRHDVRHYSEMRRTEPLAKTTEARDYLIENQQHPILVAYLAHHRPVTAMWYNTAQRLRHRLTDECGHGVRPFGQDRSLNRAGRLNRALLFAAGTELTAIEIRRGNMHNVRWLRLVVRARKSRMVAKPHRPNRRAVIGTAARYHLVTPAIPHAYVIRLRQLQCRLVGLGAALTEERARQITRSQTRQPLRKTNRRRRYARVDIHRHRRKLLVNRPCHLITTIPDVAEIHP